MAHFEIRDLTFCYPGSEDKRVLKNVNLTVNKGEYITVCGRSGSGKTTLLKHLKTPLIPHGKKEGEVLFNGMEISSLDLRTQAATIGFVMQNPDNQIVTDKVWHELAFGLESLGLDTKTIRRRVAEMASFFGIQNWFYKNVNELSGGEKQLLNLASVMVMQPEVIICDEPTSQLDPVAASNFLGIIKRINLELGTTVIMSEQRLEEVFPSSDRVAVLDGGELILYDTPKVVAGKLLSQGHEMGLAMPTAARIYYGVKKNEADENIPLTVRDGRSWLEENFAGEDLSGKDLHGDTGLKLPGDDKASTNEKNKSCDKLAKDDIAISVKDIWLRYEAGGVDVLKGAALDIPKGSFYGIVGGNGTGKTTLLKAVCGLVKPYRGHILIDGKKLEKYKKGELFKNNLVMLPQNPQALFVKKTVRDELLEMTENLNKGEGGKAAAEAAVMEMSELCNIGHIMESHPFDISGGEQQRVALAKVLLAKPKLLLMDEPTKAMDGFFKEELAKILKKLDGVTVVMVSHDIEFCAKYCDTVSLFFDGGVITTDTAKRFFAGNSFYTTAANRISKNVFEDAVTAGEVIRLCQKS